MENNKIPTAEEWIKSLYDVNSSSEVALGGKNLTDVLVKFAKLHVRAAIESVIENVELKQEWYFDLSIEEQLKCVEILEDGCSVPSYGAVVDKNTILNAYPETNIG